MQLLIGGELALTQPLMVRAEVEHNLDTSSNEGLWYRTQYSPPQPDHSAVVWIKEAPVCNMPLGARQHGPRRSSIKRY